MKNKLPKFLLWCPAAVFIAGFVVWFIAKPSYDISESERRQLAQFPSFSIETVFSGKFMRDFDKYAADQFPIRDKLRSLKAFNSFYVLRQKDVGGIYLKDGFVSKYDYPINKESLDNAAAKFKHIYEKYLDDESINVYFSIIPDKNFYMSDSTEYPFTDLDEFTGYIRNAADFMQYIDISDCLELEDFYKTDTHWKQDRITGAASRLAGKMGVSLSETYDSETLDKLFYGVYCGQAALSLPADTITYLVSPLFEKCTVYDYESGKNISVYDMEKAYGRDPYEMFLSGSKSLIKIENPEAAYNKRLIIFRDSFGSSLAPLFIEGYSEIMLVDIRYISSEILGNFISFENSDVLFIYSTLVLNNSITLK